MQTTFADRLPSDPRFKALVRELSDPLKAVGALYFVWSGTQNLGLIEASYSDIADCFPMGYRGVKRVIDALIKCSWLKVIASDASRYLIVGNERHVIAMRTISEKNRAAAHARWNALRMHNASIAHSARHAYAMPENAHPIPSHPIPSQRERESAARTESLVEISASQIPAVDSAALCEAHRAALTKRGETPALVVSSDDSFAAKVILAKLRGDLEYAKKLVRAFVRWDDNTYWKKRKWPLSILATNARDLEEANRLVAEALSQKTTPEDAP